MFGPYYVVAFVVNCCVLLTRIGGCCLHLLLVGLHLLLSLLFVSLPLVLLAVLLIVLCLFYVCPEASAAALYYGLVFCVCIGWFASWSVGGYACYSRFNSIICLWWV